MYGTFLPKIHKNMLENFFNVLFTPQSIKKFNVKFTTYMVYDILTYLNNNTFFDESALIIFGALTKILQKKCPFNCVHSILTQVVNCKYISDFYEVLLFGTLIRPMRCVLGALPH